MATAYHNEALRKQRVIERKKEATRRFIDQHGQAGQNQAHVDAAPNKDKILYSEPGHYEQNRHLYFRIGVQRERRQYDHSRNGPILDSSRYQLKKEFNFISKSTPMLR
ncbi:hypothetical protein CHS0354_007241 [Potamilus streckersoni]|uniref:Uncharacterized protein n=1 Tax=Potamilus streckersoni TaxID=2493646 RepID=A0AAE0TD77_9BIVA|nr:hypothetical protein CHS0354_007241 [Potamilus streckersoni]